MIKAKRISIIFIPDQKVSDEEIQERLKSLGMMLDDIGVSSEPEIAEIGITKEAAEEIEDLYK